MEKNTTECENTISFMESVVNRNDKDINTMKNIKKIDRKIYLISQNRIKYQWKMISKKRMDVFDTIYIIVFNSNDNNIYISVLCLNCNSVHCISY